MTMEPITHIGQLTPDQHNPRKHNPRNIGVIAETMQKVGFARSIVIDESGTILVGNGAVDAAGEIGLERVRVIDAAGDEIIAVRRTGLTQEQKDMLKVGDNRSSDLAEWDTEVLASLVADGFDLSGMWTPDELRTLMNEPPDVTFKEVDESAADDVKYNECPECGHRWPK